MEKLVKRSAIHNIVINKCNSSISNWEINEWLVIPKKILNACDIKNGEQIIVTKIYWDNWINRVKTFVIEWKDDWIVEARWSLANFYKEWEIACIVTFTLLNEEQFKDYINDKYPIFDIWFNPDTNKDNLEFNLNIEFRTFKEFNVKEYWKYLEYRKNISRVQLSTLILWLKVNQTHPDCLQWSAELPWKIMDKWNLSRYEWVAVYNVSKWWASETYAVPMPDKVVMTTWAMAKFAKVWEKVNIASFVISKDAIIPSIVFTKNNDI